MKWVIIAAILHVHTGKVTHYEANQFQFETRAQCRESVKAYAGFAAQRAASYYGHKVRVTLRCKITHS